MLRCPCNHAALTQHGCALKGRRKPTQKLKVVIFDRALLKMRVKAIRQRALTFIRNSRRAPERMKIVSMFLVGLILITVVVPNLSTRHPSIMKSYDAISNQHVEQEHTQKKDDNEGNSKQDSNDYQHDVLTEEEGEQEKNDEEEQDPPPFPIDYSYVDQTAEAAYWDYFPDKGDYQSVKEPTLHLDHHKCSSLVLDTSPPKQRPPSKGACDGYDGILHIRQGDWGGASGTIFFQFMVGFLMYADQHNLKPWVHLNSFSMYVFDEVVHNQGPGVKFTMMAGVAVANARDKRDPIGYVFPGRPMLLDSTSSMTSHDFMFEGTGVWEHYFEPVSDFSPGDPSCSQKPLVALNNTHISPGVHAHAPWAPRAFRYWMPEYIQKPDISLKEWFAPQRKRAVATTKRYIRFNEGMEQRAACAHPKPRNSLGLHIRHGDKELSRDYIPLDKFLPLCEAFVEHGGASIFLATDSALVLEEIMRDWPKKISKRIVRQEAVEGLSRNETAAFSLGISYHQTVTEALTDALALSKCTFMIHGLSALSEAAFYLNPELIERSVNLEDEEVQDPEGDFRNILSLGEQDRGDTN
jgi:hypothetical protein